jgi:hypothetical protein
MPDHVDRIVEGWRRVRPDLDVAALALLARLFPTAQLADAVLGEQLAAHGLQPGRSTSSPPSAAPVSPGESAPGSRRWTRCYQSSRPPSG